MLSEMVYLGRRKRGKGKEEREEAGLLCMQANCAVLDENIKA